GPLGALFVHLLLSSRLVQRLQAVEENARRLAHGLPLEPSPKGNDEIAELGRQIDDAAFLLRERDSELRDSERRYRELFDRAPIPYEETDREGVVRHFNQALCTLLKTSPERMQGSYAWDFVAADQQDKVRDDMMKRIETGAEAAPFECEFYLEDG